MFAPAGQQLRHSCFVDDRRGDWNAGEAGTEHATIATPPAAGSSSFLNPVAGGKQYWEATGRLTYAPILTADDLLNVGGSLRYQRPNDASRRDVRRSLYWRSKTRTPHGASTAAARRGTGPPQVFETQEGGAWLLPTGRLSSRGYRDRKDAARLEALCFATLRVVLPTARNRSRTAEEGTGGIMTSLQELAVK